MVELGGRPDLALEALDGVGVGQALLADDLQGDDLRELPVAGLEDLAHAALADAFEQDIGTQQQFLTASLQQLVGLVGSEPTPVDE